MIIEQIIKQELPDIIPNKIIFNNFTEDSFDDVSRIVIDRIVAEKKGENIGVIKIIDKIDKEKIKDINNQINEISFFEEGKIFVLFNCSGIKNLNEVLSLTEKKNYYFIVFTNITQFELNKKSFKNIFKIEFPKNLIVSELVKSFFDKKGIILDYEVIKMFDNYFYEYNTELDKILEKIYQYTIENKIKKLNKEIVEQFMFLSNQVIYFELSNLFFKKKIKKFFLLYKEYVLQENSFEKFLYIFINEIKTLLILSSLIKKSRDENYIINSIQNIGIKYNKYRFKYDNIKINNFGYKKLKDLLSFLLYCDFSLRKFQKSNVQALFEVKILEFNK